MLGEPDRIRARFNPTLVRLRRHVRWADIGAGVWFQSHAGSIEAAQGWEVFDVESSFNPTLVRLRRPGIPGPGAEFRVSIPRWFD